MQILFYFIFGLIVGSFLNALIHRLHTGESINRGRSKCPHCGHVLGSLDLVPLLSFLWLGGKCRYCRKKISWQYPLVELAAGLSFALVGFKFGPALSEQVVFYLVAVAFLLEIAVYDLKHYLILDKVLLPAVMVAFLHLIYRSHEAGSFGLHSPLVQGGLGVAIISGFFLLQYFISGGRWIGFGDVKFGVFLGMIFGVGQSLMLLFSAYLAGAVAGLGLMAMGKKELGSRMPFGTFLALCGILMILYGSDILSWYLKLLGF